MVKCRGIGLIRSCLWTIAILIMDCLVNISCQRILISPSWPFRTIWIIWINWRTWCLWIRWIYWDHVVVIVNINCNILITWGNCLLSNYGQIRCQVALVTQVRRSDRIPIRLIINCSPSFITISLVNGITTCCRVTNDLTSYFINNGGTVIRNLFSNLLSDNFASLLIQVINSSNDCLSNRTLVSSFWPLWSIRIIWINWFTWCLWIIRSNWRCAMS